MPGRQVRRLNRWFRQRLKPVYKSVRAVARRQAIAGRLIESADEHRSDRRFHEAGILYAEALKLEPERWQIQVQAGHMFKEAGEYARAEPFYAAALSAQPDNAALAVQLGHFVKTVGRLDEAVDHYERAARLRPGWSEPLKELDALRRNNGGALPARYDQGRPAPMALADAGLVPELLPRLRKEFVHSEDTVELLRYADRRERSAWGLVRTLRGVEAIRGFCISRSPIRGVEVLVDDRTIARAGVEQHPAANGCTRNVFNIWCDLSPIATGLHQVTIQMIADDGITRQRHDQLLIRPPLAEKDHPGSDGVVDIDAASSLGVDQQVRSRPSVVRPALHGAGWPIPRKVLVIRADQLGDLVVSVPAIRRLRQLLPGAEIVGLLTGANVGIARRLALFDDILVAEFPDDEDQDGRTMTIAEQERLKAAAHRHEFDLAIDMATSGMSRLLLTLTGATRTLGFGGEQWPWMSSELAGSTPDPRNRIEAVPHAGKIQSLIDRLATLLDSGARIEHLPDADRLALSGLPLPSGEAYAVLHMGARLAFSRWHGYPQLARRLIDERGLTTVILTENKEFEATVPASLRADKRLIVLGEKLDIAMFDALLGFAAVVVANDSGPKHLAAFRGAPVVSIHSARVNWSEWGQEQTGFIVSRRVPCAGCAIHHDVENCGKGYVCVTDITVDEVMDAVARALAAPPPPPAPSSSARATDRSA